MKSNPKVCPVILCGGAGTRLWPLSRKSFPKQFAVELEHRSLMDLTLERAKSLAYLDECLAVTAEDYRFMVIEALEHQGLSGNVLLEPVARNTAPAICAAALKITKTDPEAVMVILPSDHFMPDKAAFASAIEQAVRLAHEDWWVTLGIEPDKASSAYGYVEPGSSLQDSKYGYQVSRFIEKPDPETAAELRRKGCLWNAGIFIVKAQLAADLIQKHAPDIHRQVSEAVAQIVDDHRFQRLGSEPFEASRSISIDYAVLEKEPRVAVIPYAGNWSDLGSWDAVAQAHSSDENGNRAEGDVLFAGSQNCFAHSPDRLAVLLGLDNVMVVDTADAVLIAAKDKAEQVKTVVDQLKAAARPEFADHRKVARPWGTFESIDRGERYQVKRISVKPGAQLSLQYHHHRAEHWIVVRGTAKVTRDGEVFLLHENESTFIPLGAVHRLENPGKTDLELIEVQSGAYLGEDDIVRMEDVYGRNELIMETDKIDPTTSKDGSPGKPARR